MPLRCQGSCSGLSRSALFAGYLGRHHQKSTTSRPLTGSLQATARPVRSRVAAQYNLAPCRTSPSASSPPLPCSTLFRPPLGDTDDRMDAVSLATESIRYRQVKQRRVAPAKVSGKSTSWPYSGREQSLGPRATRRRPPGRIDGWKCDCSSGSCFAALKRLRPGDEGFTGHHGDRLREVHPAALAHARRRQQSLPPLSGSI